MTKDTFPARKGWQWISDWEMDINRAVDDQAWQYAIDDEQGPWVASERTLHVVRRRRWVRTRKRLEDAKKEEAKVLRVCFMCGVVCMCVCMCVCGVLNL